LVEEIPLIHPESGEVYGSPKVWKELQERGQTYGKHRVARPLRIEYPDAVYHVMNRGLARQATFRTPADYETFLQVLGETHRLCAASRRGV
jgi:hypothetical protein